MSGFLVHIMDGPAAGWEYHSFVEPDQVIAVAPHPLGAAGSGAGDWMRVLTDDPLYPGARLYERTLVTSIGTPIHPVVTDAGERCVVYKLREEA